MVTFFILPLILNSWFLILSNAVEGFGEKSGHARLAGPPGAAEQVGVANPSGLDGVLERPGNVLLAHNVGERLGAVFAV